MADISFTQLADDVAGDISDVATARASATSLSSQTVDTSAVNKPTVVSPSTLNWKSPWVLGAGGLALALAIGTVLLRRRRR